MKFQHTDLPIEKEYPKIVRDRIPEIIKGKTGKQMKQRIVENDKEFLEFLAKKLIEESEELRNSLTAGNSEEELADILEIIYAVLKVKNLTIEDIVKIQKEKREEHGGFDRRILMISNE